MARKKQPVEDVLSQEQANADLAVLWRLGRLEFLLHSDQKRVYRHYRAWETRAIETRKAGLKLAGTYPRVYTFKCSRRWGKDYLSLLVRIEDGLRKKKQILTYATAYAKDISSILLPLFEQLTATCPPDLKPIFRLSYQGVEAGLYFKNGSVIRLVGIDSNINGLRGRWSDGVTISEASFVDHLQEAVVTILTPQLQGRPSATIMLNSTPSKKPGHAFMQNFVPDCEENERFAKATILDNPLLSDAEKEEFIEAAGGRESEECRREYFVENIRSESTVVLPEFNPILHVAALPRPKYAVGYTIVDPGIRDHTAILCCYYDFERAQLVVCADWSKPGANTLEVATALKEVEARAFAGLNFWRDTKFVANPLSRYSDTDARVIADLNTLYDVRIGPVDKTESEAALNRLRAALSQRQIVIHPDAKATIAHCENGIWNAGRTSYERSTVFGHFDLLDCLKYANRMVSRIHNPNPPRGVELRDSLSLEKQGDLHSFPHHFKSSNSVLNKLNQLAPTRRFVTAGRK